MAKAQYLYIVLRGDVMVAACSTRQTARELVDRELMHDMRYINVQRIADGAIVRGMPVTLNGRAFMAGEKFVVGGRR